MQFDPSLVTGELLFKILRTLKITHIEIDDIFVGLSPRGLQPATEVEIPN